MLFWINHILHPLYHPTIIDHILKNKQKNVRICIHEIIRLILMKKKAIMKNRSHRYDINRLRSRHGRKCSKCKKSLNIMTLWCIKQHLSNIWKKGLLIKKRIHFFFYHNLQKYYNHEVLFYISSTWKKIKK